MQQHVKVCKHFGFNIQSRSLNKGYLFSWIGLINVIVLRSKMSIVMGVNTSLHGT